MRKIRVPAPSFILVFCTINRVGYVGVVSDSERALAEIWAEGGNYAHVVLCRHAMSVSNPALATPRLPKIDIGVAAA